MKIKINKIIVFICILIIQILVSGNVQARSYTIENMDIQATINKDGSVKISQSITYEFNGSYNGIYIDVPYVLNDKEYNNIGANQKLDDDLYTATGVDVLNVTDTTSQKNYLLKSKAINGDKNVYTVTKQDGITQIKIYSPSIDDTKTFIVDYIIDNVCVKHNDVGELYYNFIGGAWEEKIKDLNIDIYLPNNIRRYLYLGTWTI